jgi:hypothetical protein
VLPSYLGYLFVEGAVKPVLLEQVVLPALPVLELLPLIDPLSHIMIAGRLARAYQSLKPEQYLVNQRSSRLEGSPVFKKLSPLPGANHSGDANDAVTLVGCTRREVAEEDSFDDLKKLLMKAEPDLIVLQLDPSRFISRQRFLAHRCALNGVKEYHL